MLRIPLILGVVATASCALAQTTQPADDAAELYLSAAQSIVSARADNVVSPSGSTLVYEEYPPYSAEWNQLEQAAFAENAAARLLAYQARFIDQAEWPASDPDGPGKYLNACRALACDLADAAIYQHIKGDDAAAIETLRDLWSLADKLRPRSDSPAPEISLLVSDGIRHVCVVRLEIITAGITLTKDPHDLAGLRISGANELIGQLLDIQDASAQVGEIAREQKQKKSDLAEPEVQRLTEQLRRNNVERCLAAMSLACHLYRFETGKWPNSPSDLHAYLPTVPIDPYGDGKQTLGYAVIKGGLPDGSDRPLVYSRVWSADGLFFRLDKPTYSFYVNDGTDRPWNQQKHGGQFRDVSAWVPAARQPSAPTTQPLP